MIKLQDLEYKEFEILAGLLLRSAGHKIIRTPGPSGTRGPDYETISPDGVFVVIEVKHFKQGIGRSVISQFLGDLDRYRQQNTNTKGLLIVSSELTAGVLGLLKQESTIDIWDAGVIESMLMIYSEILPIFEALQRSKISFASQVASLMGTAQKRSDELCARLHSIPCGKNDWKEYEKICTEILTHIFAPDFGAPDIQSRSDDGLDIVDAIFPIRTYAPPWSMVRSEYRTRFVVAEFKNYCEPIGQRQVESIAQYLWSPAHRTFGLLISRHSPSASAIAQRRRQWLENQKLIVLLTDEDLCEMLQITESKGQPFDVIDGQLEDFLRTLTP